MRTHVQAAAKSNKNPTSERILTRDRTVLNDEIKKIKRGEI
jgi:hypothetical protein